ncbi:MAG: thiolase domain-containing protein [Candidatus Verstraetearchaeota archaeon]|nr:thiolase domain-containing protein [Candidatus Verstraetearchaeota archaeon]
MILRRVAVISYGMTKVDKHWNKSLRSLFGEAALNAINKVKNPKIDAIIVGNMCASDLSDQNNIGAIVADELGLTPITAYRVEAACGSGGAALLTGFSLVSSGVYNVVMVGGVEKLTDNIGKMTSFSLGKAADAEYELFYGATFASLNALLMNRYMYVYKTPREAFADFAVLMHKNGAKNPYAQLPFEINREIALNSEYIADPIRLYDCAPIGDGAAVIILCSLEEASKYTDSFVEIIGISGASDTINIASRDDLLSLKATVTAANNAYKMAKVTPKDIDVAEIHDTFTITAAISLEDLGFCERGKFDKFLYEGAFEPGGIVAINPSGGLKSRGHPVGATGVYQAAEITMQLLGEAGKMQIPNAEIGLTHNMGGVGSSVYVSIMKRVK